MVVDNYRQLDPAAWFRSRPSMFSKYPGFYAVGRPHAFASACAGAGNTLRLPVADDLLRCVLRTGGRFHRSLGMGCIGSPARLKTEPDRLSGSFAAGPHRADFRCWPQRFRADWFRFAGVAPALFKMPQAFREAAKFRQGCCCTRSLVLRRLLPEAQITDYRESRSGAYHWPGCRDGPAFADVAGGARCWARWSRRVMAMAALYCNSGSMSIAIMNLAGGAVGAGDEDLRPGTDCCWGRREACWVCCWASACSFHFRCSWQSCCILRRTSASIRGLRLAVGMSGGAG